MKSSILGVLFGVCVITQWAVPLVGIWRHEQVIAKGTLVRLLSSAPDPYDPLRGRYLQVTVAPMSLPVPKDETIDPEKPIYVKIEPGGEGESKVTGITGIKPASGLFITAEALLVYEEIRIKWPFERYYLNEKLAPAADQWLAKMRSTDKPIFAEVRVLDGEAVLVDLRQDGKSFREVLKASQKP